MVVVAFWRRIPMHRRFASLCAAVLICAAPSLHARPQPALALTADVSHVARDSWRVDYQFAHPVSAIAFDAVGDYRASAWKLRTPGLRLVATAEGERIEARNGKPFSKASIDITTFDGQPPKTYAPFSRFTDGGVAMFLGHLQGDARQGKRTLEMAPVFRLHGMDGETVIAPPPGRPADSAAQRGYAYFGPAQPAPAGSVHIILDPQTPAWVRETLLDVGARVSQYYERAYGRALRAPLLILISVSALDAPGMSINGGAVTGQLAYRLSGKQLVSDHPKKRELLSRLVAHEMAHLWQMNVERGGVGERDPWIHEGGAEAMALDALLQTGIGTQDSVAAYRQAQTATCDKLGNAVDTYDGIYACGLVRFDKTGVDIVSLWRSMMEAAQAKGEIYSPAMIEAIAEKNPGQHSAR
jgi:hypothetical protein